MEILNGIWNLFMMIVRGVFNFFASFEFTSNISLLTFLFAFAVIGIVISVFWKGGGT